MYTAHIEEWCRNQDIDLQVCVEILIQRVNVKENHLSVTMYFSEGPSHLESEQYMVSSHSQLQDILLHENVQQNKPLHWAQTKHTVLYDSVMDLNTLLESYQQKY